MSSCFKRVLLSIVFISCSGWYMCIRLPSKELNLSYTVSTYVANYTYSNLWIPSWICIFIPTLIVHNLIISSNHGRIDVLIISNKAKAHNSKPLCTTHANIHTHITQSTWHVAAACRMYVHTSRITYRHSIIYFCICTFYFPSHFGVQKNFYFFQTNSSHVTARATSYIHT
jgi:hypothetical protein